MGLRLLIGGSPCTYWSIARTSGRETEASGIGWELFTNYVIAKDKYNPDYFLYENNKSMSCDIRNKITECLGVEPILINSALVSAQNRQRLYWVGRRKPDGSYSNVEIPQPEDRGVLLRDILDSGLAVNITSDGKSQCLRATYYKDGIRNMVGNTVDRKTCVAEPISESAETCLANEVRNGQITIKGKQYPIKLADGYYIIRKLTVTECKRLQTVPDSFEFPVSDTQAYKMLGNGWTVDVIVHIMQNFDGLKKYPVDVLSMYDGMSCGHIALDKLGAHVRNYWATEIDHYCIKTATHNFPDIVQLGDAFKIREGDNQWKC